jgi:hypothetical protein
MTKYGRYAGYGTQYGTRYAVRGTPKGGRTSVPALPAGKAVRAEGTSASPELVVTGAPTSAIRCGSADDVDHTRKNPTSELASLSMTMRADLPHACSTTEAAAMVHHRAHHPPRHASFRSVAAACSRSSERDVTRTDAPSRTCILTGRLEARNGAGHLTIDRSTWCRARFPTAPPLLPPPALRWPGGGERLFPCADATQVIVARAIGGLR